jgi:hypothetical protein
MEKTEQTNKQTDLDALAIGTAEPKAGKMLEPKDVIVTDIVVKQVKGIAGKPDWEALLISVKHPDKQELVSIGKAKVEKDGNLKVVSLSLDKDEAGAIAKWSSLALVLKHYGCNKISELKNKSVKTIADQNGYLAIKAY